MLTGALVAVVTGAVVGALSYSKAPPKTLQEDLSGLTKAKMPVSEYTSNSGSYFGPTSSPTLAPLTSAAQGGVSTTLTPHVLHGLAPILSEPGVQMMIVDIMAGAWDLYLRRSAQMGKGGR